MNGFHGVHHSDRFWAGLSTDLVIEQCLMRSLKTRGGLTRGCGMTETQRLMWVLSTPSCAEMNSAMQGFTNVTYTTSEQHKDTAISRLVRDSTDTNLLLQYLLDRNPFETDCSTSLRNIVRGVTAQTNVMLTKQNKLCIGFSKHDQEKGYRLLISEKGASCKYGYKDVCQNQK